MINCYNEYTYAYFAMLYGIGIIAGPMAVITITYVILSIIEHIKKERH